LFDDSKLQQKQAKLKRFQDEADKLTCRLDNPAPDHLISYSTLSNFLAFSLSDAILFSISFKHHVHLDTNHLVICELYSGKKAQEFIEKYPKG